MLVVEQVHKSFGEVKALQGVSFQVAPGEILGLLGPNGAGKTTLLSLVAGLLAPDGGRVLIDGHSPRQMSVRARVGVAPQGLALYEELTAAENLSFLGRLYGLHGQDLQRRVQECLELAGLSSRAHDRVKTYSGGMKRRLNLLCALVHDPELLLLDEPTVGVDPQTRAYLFEWIERLRDSGKTIIYATHYMEEAARLCQRVAILDRGRLLALDRVRALVEKYGGESTVELRLRGEPRPDWRLPGQPRHGVLHWQTATPLEDLVELSRQGVTWEDVSIRSPDLETVFLKLTGRRLRDEAGEPPEQGAAA